MGCMAEIEDGQKICPFCGYLEGTDVEETYYLPPGTVLRNRYLIGKVLGYGGFGITYIGMDSDLNIKVAVKEFFPSQYATRAYHSRKITLHSGEDEEEFKYDLERFIKEAKRLGTLNNVSGVVRIFDSFQENGTGYIVMEFLKGKTIK